ncbi:hypothetical protein COLO4_06253 [Corchorus olitorius]|uniref:Uncharacterized protein n=1 Tax=Corchorus olitorius TaxID=93759 RepID=A0A1R3KNH8_9ROSI|nr:hypothetical protein COLO4_06253 [Corchorus olitorius]
MTHIDSPPSSFGPTKPLKDIWDQPKYTALPFQPLQIYTQISWVK